jgi:hypothetical protein
VPEKHHVSRVDALVATEPIQTLEQSTSPLKPESVWVSQSDTQTGDTTLPESVHKETQASHQQIPTLQKQPVMLKDRAGNDHLTHPLKHKKTFKGIPLASYSYYYSYLEDGRDKKQGSCPYYSYHTFFHHII